MDDHASSAATASLLAGLAAFYLVIAIVSIALFALLIWLYWRIFTKAGYNGALSLLNLIPIGSLICVIILAFGRWPIEDQLAALQGARPIPPPPGPPPPPPGSSVMPT